MIFIVHSGGTFTQIFMFTLTCDDVIRESQAVADAAFRARWSCKLSTPEGRRICKDLMFVIMRSRRPCCLTAGGFFPVSLETFTTVRVILIFRLLMIICTLIFDSKMFLLSLQILSTSMSYLTILRQGE